jgi:hypothetical protein
MQINRPTWYDTPELISVRVDPKKIKKSPLGNEASVSVVIEYRLYTAIVPIEAVNDDGTVVAAKVGEFDKAILISFPAGSSGTSTWAIPKSTAHLYVFR